MLTFQGGEPMLAGLKLFEMLIAFEKQYGRDGQSVGNSIQSNAVLIDDQWCGLFREYHWLVGVSLSGPRRRFDDLNYFCAAYQSIYAKALAPLRKDVAKSTPCPFGPQRTMKVGRLP